MVGYNIPKTTDKFDKENITVCGELI
jgi:hypothetical protein